MRERVGGGLVPGLGVVPGGRFGCPRRFGPARRYLSLRASVRGEDQGFWCDHVRGGRLRRLVCPGDGFDLRLGDGRPGQAEDDATVSVAFLMNDFQGVGFL